MASPRTVAVIPARYASTRFPGKPLALIAGRPMVEHVWRRCQEAGAFDEVLVATDDERIRGGGGALRRPAVMTRPDCATGTDRVAEVARGRPDVDVWVNVQGDEPLVDPAALRGAGGALRGPGRADGHAGAPAGGGRGGQPQRGEGGARAERGRALLQPRRAALRPRAGRRGAACGAGRTSASTATGARRC